jgi:hypothetical protein
VTETTVPSVGGCDGGDKGSYGCGGVGAKGVEVTDTIAAKNRAPSAKVLDRETKWVKFHGNRVVSSETTNRNKIFNNGRNKKNIIEREVR